MDLFFIIWVSLERADQSGSIRINLRHDNAESEFNMTGGSRSGIDSKSLRVLLITMGRVKWND